jgi:hypothetical protein
MQYDDTARHNGQSDYQETKSFLDSFNFTQVDSIRI